MIKFKINLLENRFPVFIGSETLPQLAEALHLYHFDSRALLFISPSVNRLYGPQIQQELKKWKSHPTRLICNEGIEVGSWESVCRLLSQLVKIEIYPEQPWIVLGGTQLLNTISFVAPLLRVQIRLIKVPTTLISQSDTAISPWARLQLGEQGEVLESFHRTNFLWTDLNLLSALPDEYYLAGVLNLIRLASIWERSFFQFVEQNIRALLTRSPDVLLQTLHRSCLLKQDMLNNVMYQPDQSLPEFGLQMFQWWRRRNLHKYRANFAVLVVLDMLWRWLLAAELGILTSGADFRRLRELLVKINVLSTLDPRVVDVLIEAIASDSGNGLLKGFLPKEIGAYFYMENIDSKIGQAALAELKRLIKIV